MNNELWIVGPFLVGFAVLFYLWNRRSQQVDTEFRVMSAECTRHQRNLDATRDPALRAMLANEINIWCLVNLPELIRETAALSNDYWRQFRLWFGLPSATAITAVINEQQRERNFYSFGEFAFRVVESIAAAGLAITYFNMPPLVGAAIGIIFALLLGTAAAAGVARWVRHDTDGQPSIQLSRITLGICVCVPLWLISAVAALFTLRSEPSSSGATIFLAATTAVTFLSPLAAGFCAYAADLLSWSIGLCTKLRWLRALERRLHQLNQLSVSSVLEERPSTINPQRGPQDSELTRNDRIPQMLKSLMVLALVLSSSLLSGRHLNAADVMPVRVFADVSPSARSIEVGQVLNSISERLEEYEGPTALEVSLVPFYSDAYSASSTQTIRIDPFTANKCAPPPEQSELGRFSVPYAKEALRRATAKCDAEAKQQRNMLLARRASQLAALNRAIHQLSVMKMSGHCSAVYAMLRRAARQEPSGISVVITDLENDCLPMTLPVNMTVTNQLFIIAVGSVKRPVEQWFDSASQALSRAIPRAQLLESFNIDPVVQCIYGTLKTRTGTPR